VIPTNTLANPVGPITGLGLFSGQPASVVIVPGTGDNTIRFRSPNGSSLTPAHVRHVTADPSWSGLPKGVPIRNTTLKSVDGARIYATIEHLMAALVGLGVWDATIELTGPEVPILDGSALPFVQALLPALRPAAHPPIPLAPAAPVRADHGGASIEAAPGAHAIAYALDYGPGSPLKPHTATWDGSARSFIDRIAPARTFSMRAEAEAATALGLFASFTPKDLPVVADDGSLIDNAWRLEHEAAAHKLLDLIGDLALLGSPLAASVTARKSGHALTHDLCRALLTLPSVHA